jgi:hypothetical protein
MNCKSLMGRSVGSVRVPDLTMLSIITDGTTRHTHDELDVNELTQKLVQRHIHQVIVNLSSSSSTLDCRFPIRLCQASAN